MKTFPRFFFFESSETLAEETEKVVDFFLPFLVFAVFDANFLSAFMNYVDFFVLLFAANFAFKIICLKIIWEITRRGKG